MANQKITQLTATTTPETTDIIPIVTDPAGTPATKKVSIANLSKGIALDNVPEGTTNKNFTSSEKTKLSNIEAGANNYVHPATHSADIIVDGSTNKAYTGTEKMKLSGIAEGANNYTHPATHSADILTDGATNKAYTAAEQTKLAGIATGATAYTDEMAQDAVGGMVDASLTYTDATPQLKVTNPVTPQTNGFTITAGTTPKTLTVAADASVSGTNTGDQDLSDVLTKVQFADINRNGFLNQTETTISFNGVDTFTLGSVGASWSYYRAGIKYTITGSKTKQVANPMVDNTLYYIFIDANDGTLSSSTSAWTLEDSKIPVATLYWNNSLTPKFVLSEERHTILMDRRDHLRIHTTQGTQYKSGGALTGPNVASSTNSEKTVGIEAATIFDEDIIINTLPIARGNGTDPTYTVMYRTAASTWAWAKYAVPFKYTGAGAIEYDSNGTMTAAGAGSGGNTRYINYYMVLSNIQGEASVVFVPGRSAFTSTTAAYNETFSSFSMVGFPPGEAVAIYQFTWNTNGTGLGLARLTRTPVRINTNIVTTTAISSQNHNSLTGLQGGTLNEYYHLTSTEKSLISDDAINFTSEPASDHMAYGLKTTLVANEAQNFGDVCFINASGKAQLGDADAIATSSCTVMCVSASVAQDGTGTYMIPGGIARDDTWNWTVGGLIYLSTTGTTGNTLTQTAPSGTDDVIQIIGVATHADRMFFNPQLVQVEHA